MSDIEIIDGLLNRDERIILDYFFVKLRPLFVSILRQVYRDEAFDYDEMVNEFYIYLMENDGHRLKQFGFQTSLYQWMRIVALRFFMQKNMEDKPD